MDLDWKGLVFIDAGGGDVADAGVGDDTLMPAKASATRTDDELVPALAPALPLPPPAPPPEILGIDAASGLAA